LADPLECFAVAAPGIEPITAREVALLGVTDVATEAGGVTFRAALAQVQDANLRLRTASRVLVRVARFRARTFFELERHATKLDWGRWLAPGVAPEFDVTSKKSKLYHEKGIAQRLATAAGSTTAADVPAQLFVVRVQRDEFTLSIDSSGELLHRRGYRQETAKAPLRETLAAAMLLGAGWHGQAPLVDPMCGSGTIPIEAALIARGIAPGLGRGFAFEAWPSFELAGWRAVRARAEAEVMARSPVHIAGSDRDAGAVAAACANAARAGVAEDVSFGEAPLSSLDPPEGAGFLVSNPPYGVRVGEEARLRDLYATLGRLVTQRLDGWTVALLTANPRLDHATGLDWREVLRTSNGGIPVRLIVHPAI
jgi:putative N6-adenine-specific DNA methylase